MPTPCLVGVLMGMVCCMVPVRGQKRARSQRSPSGAGGWLTSRRQKPDDVSLKSLNNVAAAALGQAWDLDFICMEVSANSLPILAEYWEIGGRLARSADSDFPPGLEIASSPFTLRIASIRHASMTKEHEALLVEAAKKLRNFLKSSGVTGHPILAAPDTLTQQALQLAKKERLCSGEQLAAAVEHCLPASEWQVYVCRYGLKIEASTFFAKLCAIKPVIEADLGALRSRTAWSSKVLDFGTQSILNGKVCLVAPIDLKFLDFLDSRKTSTYSLFGVLGGSYGGVEMSGTAGFEVLKIIAYPGNYTHQMKARGAPNAFPPRGAAESWFSGQWSQVQACLAALDGLDDCQVAGLRLEIRVSSTANSWQEMKTDLDHWFSRVAAQLATKEIEFAAIMDNAKVAVGEAEAAGLFQCGGAPSSEAPSWKFHNWGRLMHYLGISNKYTHRFAYRQSVKGAPWGGASLEEEADIPWVVNPSLPPKTAVITIPSSMPAQTVQCIGRDHASKFHWGSIAEHLGKPEAASLLQRVCSRTK